MTTMTINIQDNSIVPYLLDETLIPAYGDVLKAEKKGIDYPDISELFKEIGE